jgi:hypothetical protein
MREGLHPIVAAHPVAAQRTNSFTLYLKMMMMRRKRRRRRRRRRSSIKYIVGQHNKAISSVS